MTASTAGRFAAALLIACATLTGGAHATTTAPSAFDRAMTSAMNDMMTAMDHAPANGEADHDFATMMIAHHRGALDMAKLELRDGRDERLRRVAQEIVVTQQSEIDLMNTILRARAMQSKGIAHVR
jgi:uncharacterized protein (DUF305 family)